MHRFFPYTAYSIFCYKRHIFIRRVNITGVPESRAIWAKDLNLSKDAEYTFFAGCGYQHMKSVEGMMRSLKRAGKIGMGVGKVVGISKMLNKVGVDAIHVTAKLTASKEDPYTPVLVSSIRVLQKLGLDVGYLGEEEPCCGSPVYYAGFDETYAQRARDNCRLFKSRGMKKVIGLVPACTSALKNVYPKYVEDYDLQVQHVVQVAADRMAETDARPAVGEKVRVTYHDPCQLSRYLAVIDEPRDIIRSIDGVEFVEPDAEKVGKWSTCCGGGGLEATHGELSERIGARRIEELLATGASVILSNCPACEMQLANAAKKLKANVKVVNLMKFLDDALP